LVVRNLGGCSGRSRCVSEVVPSDRLAEIVWGDSPPRSADANLLTHVSSLRRKLRLATVGLTTMIISRKHGRLRIFKLENLDQQASGTTVRENHPSPALRIF
jgi:DNA-binding SARP family transcriptional activator